MHDEGTAGHAAIRELNGSIKCVAVARR